MFIVQVEVVITKVSVLVVLLIGAVRSLPVIHKVDTLVTDTKAMVAVVLAVQVVTFQDIEDQTVYQEW